MLDNALNDAQQEIATRLGSMVDDTEYTVSTVAGTQEYNLPSDFGMLQTATYNGTKLQKTSLEELKNMYSTSNSWSPYYYYLRRWVIGLYPIPDTVWSLYMLYNNLMPTMTTSVDATLPSYMDKALLCLSASELLWPVNIDKAEYRKAKYEQAFNMAFITAVADLNLTM